MLYLTQKLVSVYVKAMEHNTVALILHVGEPISVTVVESAKCGSRRKLLLKSFFSKETG